MNLIVGELPGHSPLSATDQNLPHPLETHLTRWNYMYYVKVIPGTQLTSIFLKVNPSKQRSFRTKTSCHLGSRGIYIHTTEWTLQSIDFLLQHTPPTKNNEIQKFGSWPPICVTIFSLPGAWVKLIGFWAFPSLYPAKSPCQNHSTRVISALWFLSVSSRCCTPGGPCVSGTMELLQWNNLRITIEISVTI